MNRSIICEACVETADEALAAEKNGADRLELCAALDKDGLTPSVELTRNVLSMVSIPVKVMIRLREGNFEYTADEMTIMLDQASELSRLHVKGFVFGAMRDGKLDLDMIRQFARHAGGIPVTVHKAIDHTDDPVRGVSQLIQLHNIEAVLTSGGASTAFDGKDTLNAMHDAAKGRLQIIAAGKITNENLEALQDILKVQEYHGRRIVGTL